MIRLTIDLMPIRDLKSRLISPLSATAGQTAIFVFVLLLVGLTIGLSVAGRTFRDLQSSGSSDFSARAFTAAEAGAEEALRQDLATVAPTCGQYICSSDVAPSFGTANKSSFKYKVDTVSQLTQTVARDDSVQLNMISGANFFDGTLKIYWGKLSDNTNGGENTTGNRPSLEITLLARDSNGEFGYAKFAVNSETRPNNFTAPTGVLQPVPPLNQNFTATYANSIPDYINGALDTNPAPNLVGANPPHTGFTNVLLINLTNADRVAYVRIRPLYNRATLGVESLSGSGTHAFPAQSYKVTSQGNSGDATRAVQVTKSLPSLPPILDFALFNGSTSKVGK